MKRFAIIGLGKFGFHVARTLFEEGSDVIAIDMDKEKVQKVQEFSTFGIVADAADKDFLLRQGMSEMDAVVVSTGHRSHVSTLITLYLKEIGVTRILVKAVDEDHGRILTKIGATDIIFPEKETALKIAKNLISPNVLEFLPLAEEYSITEISPPPHFIGKNLLQLDLRKRFNVTVIAIKDVASEHIALLPPPQKVIKESDLLVLIGKSDDIEGACR